MADRPVYLDHAASSPLRPEALAAMSAYDASAIAGANPNSLHTLGRRAARELDGARRALVDCLGGHFRPSDVTLTSGGTESNNLAVIGLAEGARGRLRFYDDLRERHAHRLPMADAHARKAAFRPLKGFHRQIGADLPH